MSFCGLLISYGASNELKISIVQDQPKIAKYLASSNVKV